MHTRLHMSPQYAAANRAAEIRLQDRPVAGVLVSASADGMGEIFPLYVGRNRIGSSSDSDVYLPEASVSPHHAVILVRKTEEAGSAQSTIQVGLTDYDSDYGTWINGVRAGFEKEMLKGDEILQFGQGYGMKLFLFDSSIPGLGLNPLFQPLPREQSKTGKGGEGEKLPVEIGSGSVGVEDEFAFYGRPAKAQNSEGPKPTVDNMASLYGRNEASTAPQTVYTNHKPGDAENAPRGRDTKV